MIRYSAAAIAAASIAFTAPASATTITFAGGSSALDGTDGNILPFSGGGVKVQAAAYSYDQSTLERAWLGWYSSGLGVTNNNEGAGTSNNSHTIDNVGQKDFVLLIFDRPVNVASAVLTPFTVSSDPRDNDVWVSYANFALPFTSPGTQVPLNSALWAALNGVDYTVGGHPAAPYSVNINPLNHIGNVWMIGAANPNPDYNDDGFKLTSITFSAPVPEPSTWALMLLGFTGIGLALRRARPSFKLADQAPTR